MKRITVGVGLAVLITSAILDRAGMSWRHIAYLWWIGFILSAGFVCGAVAWKTFRLRRRHRMFHYFGLVKTALFLSTLNGTYGIIQLIRARGLSVFDSLGVAQYRGLAVQTLVALALWALALYLFGKLNGEAEKEQMLYNE